MHCKVAFLERIAEVYKETHLSRVIRKFLTDQFKVLFLGKVETIITLTSSASKNRAKRGGNIPTLTARQTNQPGMGKEWGLAIRWKVRRGSQSA